MGWGWEGGAAAAAQNGVQSAYKDIPGKKTLAVRLLLFVEWKRGKKPRVFTSTFGQVSKYPSLCTKKGDGIFDYFKTHVCPVEEGKSVKSQCVYVYSKVYAFHLTF